VTAPTRRQVLLLAAALAATAGVAALARHGRPAAPLAARVDLARLFPESFADWQVDPASRAFVRPNEAPGKVYGLYDQVLERTFVNAQGQRIMLSVAYGGDQSTRLQLHRPEVCYRASGYEVENAGTVPIRLAGREVPVTRLHANKPGRSEPITYWTTLGGEVAGSGSAFQWRRITHALQGDTLEGVLVRISSIDHEPARAYALQSRFAQALAQALPADSTQQVVGASL
jgi:EpsI family protein